MTYDEMNGALAEAARVQSITDGVSERLANLLIGRLRKINNRYTLRKLKAELGAFNSTTGKWAP